MNIYILMSCLKYGYLFYYYLVEWIAMSFRTGHPSFCPLLCRYPGSHPYIKIVFKVKANHKKTLSLLTTSLSTLPLPCLKDIWHYYHRYSHLLLCSEPKYHNTDDRQYGKTADNGEVRSSVPKILAYPLIWRAAVKASKNSEIMSFSWILLIIMSL